MKRLAKIRVAAYALIAASGYATTASAQSDETRPVDTFEISANFALVSDYRYRGISLSDRDPAVQGGFDVSHESGLFVGTWASSIADYGGSKVEVDVYGGYAGHAVGVDYSVSALGYFYPGGSGVDYLELKGTAGKTVGPAAFELEVAWVPNQDNYPGDNIYVAAGASIGIPDTPFTVNVRGGRESSEFLKKWDWEAGVAYSFGKLTGSLDYVDSDYDGIDEAGRLGRAGIVATLLAKF
jgi:uncharacterized protein (TIGR02001 family)